MEQEAGAHGAKASEPPLVALAHIVKRYGTFAANNDISLDIRAGEIHAILGENGAGKSTLMKILYGLIAPTSGTLEWQGVPFSLRSPQEARARGIGMVFQHFSLFENLTVADNIALVLPASENLKGLSARIGDLSRRYGIALEPERPVWSLSAGERQRIEIARCLLQDPRVLILDEPTSVLTPQEANALFMTLEKLKSEGRALVYISHKLDEVRQLCDRATILRMGRVVGTCIPREESARSMAALMVGAQIGEVKGLGSHRAGDVRLCVAGLNLEPDDLHGTPLRNVSLEVRSGEIVGLAGIAGNGQSELFAALSGEVLAKEPHILQFEGRALGTQGVTHRRLAGAAFVPEERNGHAAAPDFSLSDNVILSRHATGGIVRHGVISAPKARKLSQDIIKAFDVRTSAEDPPARTLSGGNLQKFVVGREIMAEPRLLVVDQPTWGVDAAAAAAIRQALVDLAARGAAILVISQDLDELFEICDRIGVIHAGTVSPPMPASQTTREAIGLLMGGQQPEPQAYLCGDGIHAA